MRQPTIDELFDRIYLPESNRETDKYKENEIVSESVNIINVKEIPFDTNGIVEVRYGNEIYRTWKVEFIRPYIIKFLKEKYPDSLIIQELNKIDFTLIDNNSDEIIPIEIQKTPLNRNIFSHHTFEDNIRRQLNDNIENYGKCWFFFDSEYLKFLQSKNVGKNTSIDLTWLVKLMKEKDFKVFVIRYDGVVKELTTKDFDFLKDISQTCIIGYNNDERELNRNKLKIYKNIIKGHKFTQEEIDNFYSILNDEDDKSNKSRSRDYFIKSKNKRCKLYGTIILSVSHLDDINNIMNMSEKSIQDIRISRQHLIYMGIFDNNGACGRENIVKFVDKFDICKHFPGYIRNREQWESYRNININYGTFISIVSGSLKFNKTMFDY